MRGVKWKSPHVNWIDLGDSCNFSPYSPIPTLLSSFWLLYLSSNLPKVVSCDFQPNKQLTYPREKSSGSKWISMEVAVNKIERSNFAANITDTHTRVCVRACVRVCVCVYACVCVCARVWVCVLSEELFSGYSWCHCWTNGCSVLCARNYELKCMLILLGLIRFDQIS